LSLDDSIDKFFPDAPTDKRAITVRQLLSHTSGLRQSYVSEGVDDRATAVQRMLAEPLASAPGARFGYSNNNYQLAVAIVEVASGKPYREYVRHLWDRAALNATGFAGEAGATSVASVPNDLPERLARTYWGGEGVFSTTRDLLVWYRALRGGKLLSPPNVDTLFTPIAPIQEGATALGWFLGKTSRGAATVFTRGNEDFGANALFYAYPESDIVIIILTHAGSTSDARSWSRVIHARIEELMSL
jgi:CubicO group peptidase (beta-lactamase class C family)